MLAQWVPLHAVSCSNLIETGGCAESREIPLRVTQTCSGCCSCALALVLRIARGSRSRAVGRTLLFLASMPDQRSSFLHIAKNAFKTVDRDPRNARVPSRESPAVGNRRRASHGTSPKIP